MLTEVQHAHLSKAVRTMQIIGLALLLGPLFLLGFVLVSQQPKPVAQSVMPNISLGAAVLALAAWWIIPNLVAARASKKVAAGEAPFEGMRVHSNPELSQVASLTTIYQARMIIGTAILEGVTFFNITTYMTQGKPILLGAVAMLLLLLLVQIPTRGRLEVWVRGKLETNEYFPG